MLIKRMALSMLLGCSTLVFIPVATSANLEPGWSEVHFISNSAFNFGKVYSIRPGDSRATIMAWKNNTGKTVNISEIRLITPPGMNLRLVINRLNMDFTPSATTIIESFGTGNPELYHDMIVLPGGMIEIGYRFSGFSQNFNLGNMGALIIHGRTD
ncbi:hypothetical protein [Paenibacillus methanolicus]|uniref:hypothetical protein n=1 Tax=Paenibacillus methanolicus TaxID=582686 RepID=UPI0011E70EEA|nr:hypothetical protein [Paenibacillus methanolicus]